MQTVLEIKNLSVSFRIEKQWVKAVEDVSFEVGAGETLGIVGESGCGKSVTSMATLHLLPEKTSRIDCGQVLYRGRDLAPLSNKEMSEIRGKEISMIFQDSMTSFAFSAQKGNLSTFSAACIRLILSVILGSSVFMCDVAVCIYSRSKSPFMSSSSSRCRIVP